MGFTFPKKVAPGGEFSRKVLLGVPNPTFWRNANGDTYYGILFTNNFVLAITDKNICTKFGKNL